ncbi:MAG: hypothetical protein ACRCT8_16525 [Lacipirellulaceae bacterium]
MRIRSSQFRAAAQRVAQGAAIGAVLAGLGANASAQMPGGGVYPALHQQPMAPPYSLEGDYVNAHGEPIVTPASYGAPCGCPSCSGGGMMGGCLAGPNAGAGLSGYDPMGGAGLNTEQCGPHYFDFSAEYLRYERDGSPIGAGRVISTFGFANSLQDGSPDPTSVFAQRAITDETIGGGTGDGYRLTGRIDVGALSVFEIAYSGIYDTDGNAGVAIADTQGTITPGNPSDNQTLYTVFNDFGSRTGGVVDPNGPFRFTDNALEHRIGYESELHTAEALFRRYWVGYSPRVSGTVHVGFRYTNLQEEISFFSRSDFGSTTFAFDADNRLAGCQAGVDGWVTIVQGLRVGSDVKAGVYNNNYRVGTVNGDTAAFLGELRLSLVADLTPSWSFKTGYELLFISDLALAGDNLFVPGGFGGATTATSADVDGEAFFHGFHVGAEYVY